MKDPVEKPPNRRGVEADEKEGGDCVIEMEALLLKSNKASRFVSQSDLWLYVLQYLTISDLVSASCVSKTWRDLVDTDASWTIVDHYSATPITEFIVELTGGRLQGKTHASKREFQEICELRKKRIMRENTVRVLAALNERIAVQRHNLKFFTHLFLGPICSLLNTTMPLLFLILLSMKLDGDIGCSWFVVFWPLLALFGAAVISLFFATSFFRCGMQRPQLYDRYSIWKDFNSRTAGAVFAGFEKFILDDDFADNFVGARLACGVLFCILALGLFFAAVTLPLKLDEVIMMSWYQALAPLWAGFGAVLGVALVHSVNSWREKYYSISASVFVVFTALVTILAAIDEEHTNQLSPLEIFVPTHLGYGLLLCYLVYEAKHNDLVIILALALIPCIITSILLFLVSAGHLQASAKEYLSPMFVLIGIQAVYSGVLEWQEASCFLADFIWIEASDP